ncbi:MAG: hypothetical protein WCK91_02600 [bacterium]
MELPKTPVPGENIYEQKTDRYYESYFTTTVSVKDLIPDINLDGLSIKNIPSDDQEGPYRFIDEDENRKIKHLQSGFSTSFAYSLFSEEAGPDGDIRKAVDESFRDQIVIDLAAGENLVSYRMADHARAKSFIAVEPAFYFNLYQNMFALLHPEIKDERGFPEPQEKREQQYRTLNKIPVAIVAEDMLSFLKRLPANSVSIWCSGIDNFVIPDQQYKDDVAKEILRVLHPDGSYIGQIEMSITIPVSSKMEVRTVGEKNNNRRYRSINIYKKIN